MNSKGFTLIEVLVALTIVGIMGSSLFVILNQSLFTLDLMKRRLSLLQYNYERVSLELSMPDTAFINQFETDTGELVEFESEITDTLLPTLFVKKITTKGLGSQVQLYYYLYED